MISISKNVFKKKKIEKYIYTTYSSRLNAVKCITKLSTLVQFLWND